MSQGSESGIGVMEWGMSLLVRVVVADASEDVECGCGWPRLGAAVGVKGE